MKTLHESDDQLELYALDRLPEDAVERVEEHLIVCEPCRVRFEEVGEFAVSMRQTLRTAPELVTPRRLGWFEGWQIRFAFGGAVACALALAFFATQNQKHASLPPMASLSLAAMRGTTPVVHPAQQLDLRLAGATGDNLAVEIFDSNGQAVWQGRATVASATAHTVIRKELAAGSYFVRLKQPTGELLHEYGFDVRP